ncbi:hypothetical protein HK100_012702 [Physocladia obscura]|uniref:Uncharacterized protein n=1 Tax=Physocladia obscura TaxID=109957 RepID=A0AAD5T268_9FUNG|nr:hypothetical protein HK100_012702 [Physocladia obscura]
MKDLERRIMMSSTMQSMVEANLTAVAGVGGQLDLAEFALPESSNQLEWAERWLVAMGCIL